MPPLDLDSDDLTQLERRFRDYAHHRDGCDLRDGSTDMLSWGEERYISAHVVRAVLVRGITESMPDDAVISLKGAVIRGDLNLDGVRLPPMRMESCLFLGKVSFDRAVFTGEARFDGSRFQQEARFAESTFSTDARFDRVDFAYAEFYKVNIAGDAMFYEAKFRGRLPVADPAVCAHFRRARFGGDAHFRRAVFDREALLMRAHFEGDAHFGALGDEPSWVAIPERASSASFNGLARFDYALFDNYAGFKNTCFDGGADFYQATFGGDADFYRAAFMGDARLRFERTKFRGNAEFRGSTFGGPAQFPNAKFDGDANFGDNNSVLGAHFSQTVDFSEAVVASHADFCGTTFDCTATFDLLWCKRMTLNTAKFGPQSCLSAEGLKSEILNLRIASPPQWLSLKDAQIVTIEDRQDAWPPERILTGCSFGRIQADYYIGGEPVSATALWPPSRWVPLRKWADERSLSSSGPDKMGVMSRIEWLKGEKGYDPFRYDQVIAAYRLAGDETNASAVALAKQRERRGTLSPPGRFWGLIQDWLVGYGYRLWLPVVWIVALVIAGSLTFDIGKRPNEKAPFPSFESLYYTTDLLFPVVNLGSRSNFEFEDWRIWLAYGFMLVGWLLAASVIAGVQRVLSQRQ